MILFIILIIVVVALVFLIPQYIKLSGFKKPDKKTLVLYIAATALTIIIRFNLYFLAKTIPSVYYSGLSVLLFLLVYSLIKILRNKDFEKDKKAMIATLVWIAAVIVCLIVPIVL